MAPRLQQLLGGGLCAAQRRGGKGALSTELPEGSHGFGLGLAKPPVLARGCSAAVGLFLRLQGPGARNVHSRHHQHPGLSPVPQLSHCTFQQAPSTSPALSLQPSASLGSACLPALHPGQPQGSVTMSHTLSRG